MQSGIVFQDNITLEKILEQAKLENKKIFIDSYTKWCLPCKNLDIVFTDKALGEYFNANFINAKFDMDLPVGKAIHQKYDVVFVPTMLILDQNGFTIIKFDSANNNVNDLLSIAKRINEPSVSMETDMVDQPKGSPAEPTTASSENTVKEENEEKVLYVMGNHNNTTPEHLKQKAYFRLQLMDGSHHLPAEKYLATKADWLTLETMRFIYNFLLDTDSRMFSFFVENKNAFENEFGADAFFSTLNILIEKKLNQAMPRPSYEEGLRLYSYLDPKTSESRALEYINNRNLLKN